MHDVVGLEAQPRVFVRRAITAPHEAGLAQSRIRCMPHGAYRSPAAAPGGSAASISARSRSSRRTAAAPAFSSRCATVFVPGIGTTSSCRSNHASASCGAEAALALRQRRDRVGEAQVRGEILGAEARVVPARIVGRQILGTAEASGEKTATERAIGDEADAEFARRSQHAVGLDVARPKRKLALQRGDRVPSCAASRSHRPQSPRLQCRSCHADGTGGTAKPARKTNERTISNCVVSG